MYNISLSMDISIGISVTPFVLSMLPISTLLFAFLEE